MSYFRGIYLQRVKEEKGAREQVKGLNPSTQYLFGGQVSEVSKDLKDSEELNPLAVKKSFKPSFKKHAPLARGGGSGGSFPNRFKRGASSSFSRGRGKAKSMNKEDRLAKFKDA